MWRKWVLSTILAGALAAGVAAQSAPKFLTNDDVVTMVKAGQAEDSIVSAIQNQGTDFDVSAKSLLQLKKAGVTKKVIDAMVSAVKDQKEAAAAVVTMAQDKAAAEEAEAKAEAAKEDAAKAAHASAMAQAQSGGAPGMPGTSGMPSVTMVQGTQKQALAMGHTQIVPAGTGLGQAGSQMGGNGFTGSSMDGLANDGALTKNLASLAQSFAGGGGLPGMGGIGGLGKGGGVASMMMMANPMIAPVMIAGKLLMMKHKAAQAQANGGTGDPGQSVTAVWTIPGAKSETLVHGQPAFDVQFNGVAGINPDDYEPVLIRLTPNQSNFRLVGATAVAPSELQDSQANWSLYSSFVEQRVASQATKVSPGSYQLKPSDSLAPGEYAVVLRPINKDKKFVGANVGQNVGDGLAFNSVWSFEVQ